MEFRTWLEDAERDRKTSNLALKVWDRIVKEFDRLELKKMSLSLPVAGKSRTLEVRGWGFDLGGLFPEFSGLDIFICNSKGSGAASYDPRSKTILLPLVSDWEEPDERIVRLRFRTWHEDHKWNFVHEFIHYMDDSRGLKFRDKREPKGTSPSPEAYRARRDREYFNTPEEFNAYYQSLVAFMNKKLRPKDFEGPFPEFMKRASEMTPGFEGHRWPDFLDEEYKRKFTKRLYQYYLMRRSRNKGLLESSDLEDEWKDYLSWKSSQGEEWGSNTKDNLDRLERIRRMGIERNAQGTQDHSARMKSLLNWFHAPDGKSFEYQTPEGSYTIRKDDGDFRPGGDWKLTAPDGESIGHYPTPEAAAEEAGADWGENFI